LAGTFCVSRYFNFFFELVALLRFQPIDSTMSKKNAAQESTIFTQKKVEKTIGIVDKELAKYKTFSTLAKKTKIPRLYLACGLLSTFFFTLVFGFGAEIVGKLISLVWPAYRSFMIIDTLEKLVQVKQENIHPFGRATREQDADLELYQNLRKTLRMKDRNIKREDLGTNKVEEYLELERKELLKQCNLYAKKYLIYWVVYGILYLSDYIFAVLSWFIPFYGLLKISFLIWCVHPRWGGAITIYDVFSPILRRNKGHIESWIHTWRNVMEATFVELKEETSEVLNNPVKRRKFTENTALQIDIAAKKVVAVGSQVIAKLNTPRPTQLETEQEKKKKHI